MHEIPRQRTRGPLWGSRLVLNPETIFRQDILSLSSSRKFAGNSWSLVPTSSPGGQVWRIRLLPGLPRALGHRPSVFPLGLLDHPHLIKPRDYCSDSFSR